MSLVYTALSKRLAGFLLLSLFSIAVTAQQKTKIILQSSERSRIVTKTDITYLRKPVFRQDNAILTCDSAVFYTAKNYFEAYDNVHINQADTINIYSDRLTYDGNAKLAHLTSNVRLVDKTSTLTTNVLDYSMGPKVGTYVDGGKIVNKDAVITSKNGYYFANTRDAYFRYNVLVVTDQSTIKSDTLRYNTFSNWAYFYGPTNIKEKDGNLYTENGAYNTKTTYAYFGKNNLYTSGSKSLKGDSLYYDGIAGYGKAVKNIVFRDTVDKMLMRGQLGYYYKKDQRTLVTKNAYVGMATNDSVSVDDGKKADVKSVKGSDTKGAKAPNIKDIKGSDVKGVKLTDVKGLDTSGVKLPSLKELKLPDTSGVKLPDVKDIKIPDTKGVKLPDIKDIKVPDTKEVKSTNGKATEAKPADSKEAKVTDNKDSKSSDTKDLKASSTKGVKLQQVREVKIPDTLWLGADTLETQMVRQGTLKLLRGPVIKKDNELGEEERDGKVGTKGKTGKAAAAPSAPKKPAVPVQENTKNEKAAPEDKKKKKDAKPAVTLSKEELRRDSLVNDSILAKKVNSLLRGPLSSSKNIDSVLKTPVTTYKSPNLFKKGFPPVKRLDSVPKNALTSLKTVDLFVVKSTVKNDPSRLKKTLLSAVKKITPKDIRPFNPLDTILVRSIKAYHHVNVFKSNMQAKADSLFYTSADSTLRWYKNPIIWAQGSQLTGDTIYAQLRNKKINSVQVINTAFAVNVEPDSAKFNQIKGKLITGFFKDGKLTSMYVDGNAESVYFTKTDDGKKYDKLNQTISSRIKINFKGSEIADVVPIKNVEGATTPVEEVKQEVILTGFIWKPEFRPRSKRDITNPRIIKAKTPVVKKSTEKTDGKPSGKSDSKSLDKTDGKPSDNTDRKPLDKTAVKVSGKTDGKSADKPAAASPATKTPAATLKSALPAAVTNQIPAGTMDAVKQLTKTADSLNLKDKIPAKVIDTAMKMLPKLIQKADSLSKQPVPLKK